MESTGKRASLANVDEWFKKSFSDLSFYGTRLAAGGFVPGKGGDISVLMPPAALSNLQRTPWYNPGPERDLLHVSTLAADRTDGEEGYGVEDIPEDVLSKANLASLDGRAILSTVSAARPGLLAYEPERRMCVVSIGSRGQSFRMEYGHHEHGTIPAQGFPTHLTAHAINLEKGFADSTVVHVHPQQLIDLSRHEEGATVDRLNHAIYTQRIELLQNVPELVGFLPYLLPGSVRFFEEVMKVLVHHRAVVLQHHGVLIRERTLEQCLEIIEYLESSAAAALRDVALHGALHKLSNAELAALIKYYRIKNTSILELSSSVSAGHLMWAGKGGVEPIKEGTMMHPLEHPTPPAPQGLAEERPSILLAVILVLLPLLVLLLLRFAASRGLISPQLPNMMQDHAKALVKL